MFGSSVCAIVKVFCWRSFTYYVINFVNICLPPSVSGACTAFLKGVGDNSARSAGSEENAVSGEQRALLAELRAKPIAYQYRLVNSTNSRQLIKYSVISNKLSRIRSHISSSHLDYDNCWV